MAAASFTYKDLQLLLVYLLPWASNNAKSYPLNYDQITIEPQAYILTTSDKTANKRMPRYMRVQPILFKKMLNTSNAEPLHHPFFLQDICLKIMETNRCVANPQFVAT